LDTQQLDLAPGALDELLRVDAAAWHTEFQGISDYLDEFGDRVPTALEAELAAAMARVTADR
jgi:phosphoenolpyruvate carboxykinase (GTP)